MPKSNNPLDNPPTPKSAPDAAADPDLTAIVAAWPSLPAAIRAGIVAMVEASKGA